MPQPIRAILVFLLSPLATVQAQQYGWQVIAQPTTQSLLSVEFVDSLNGWIGGSNGAIYRTPDGGTTLFPFGVAFQPSSISMYDGANGWAAGNQGRIYHTTNGGVNWFRQRDVFDQQYNGTAAQSVLRNTTSGGKYTGPDTGLVIQTSNGGATWTVRTIADSVQVLGKVQFVDSLHGWVRAGIRTTDPVFPRPAIVRTTDGGATWIALQGPILFVFIDTLRGWGVTRNSQTLYKTVLRSVDGGTIWDSISTIQDPDAGIVALSFVDSLNGWMFGGTFYQGGSVEVIYRTSDGGYNWIRESIGLSEDITDAIMVDRYHGWAVAFDGRVLAYRPTTGVVERVSDRPTGFRLHQNYPNPFNPMTTIEYEVATRSQVRVAVYDVSGKEITVLVHQQQEPGVYRVRFDGSELASGTYYCRMDAGTFAETKQLILVK